MELSVKSKWIFWLLVLLVMINITVLLILFLYRPVPVANGPADIREQGPAGGLIRELSLTAEQEVAVQKINEGYRAVTGPLADEIRAVRAELLDELASDLPDTVKMNAFITGLGRLQIRLQKESIGHYLALKKVCSPEQAKRLSDLFGKLYGCDQAGQGKGKGQGKGMQHRYRRGKN
jgi:Spy/CpxP family protein refolding chaperone